VILIMVPGRPERARRAARFDPVIGHLFEAAGLLELSTRSLLSPRVSLGSGGGWWLALAAGFARG
jgi:hypothetical protein